jgi:thiosulfate/3-mercaptopyruvate sulfurtransferase
MGDYAQPEVLVSTDWVAEHAADPGVRLLEVDVDTSAYAEGHIQGAVGVNWTSQLSDQVRRDLLTPEQFERLCGKAGIGNDTTVVFYGDNNNWFACYALWQFRYYGHPESRLKIMNGGRAKWIAEGRPLVKDAPQVAPTSYKARAPDLSVRAQKEDVFHILGKGSTNLVDVRSPAEFTGEVIAPPGMNETAQRGGHIPGARSIPWAQAVREDGTFKTYDDLKKLYEGKGIDLTKDTIAYCRIGERSSHSWFVLKYLLGQKNVKNYDGSWTEWGNLVGAPIEKP